MKQAFLSIITVCRNDLENLQKTLSSISRQSYTDYEVVVIDGASDDGTVEWMNSLKDDNVRFFSEPDAGIYDAMNKGIDRSKGKHLNFLNAGDLYYDEFVLTEIFKHQKGDLDLIYGDAIVSENVEGKSEWYQGAYEFNEKNLLDVGTAVLCHQAVFIKKEICPKYDLKYKFKAELNWYFDILEQNKELNWRHISKAVVIYFTGGFGYINFNKNLKESLKVIIDRYGFFKLIRYKTLLMILGKLSYRYKYLRYLKNRIVKNRNK